MTEDNPSLQILQILKLAKPAKKYKLQSCTLGNPGLSTNQQCRTQEQEPKAEAKPRENEEVVAIIQFSICERANKRWSGDTSTRRVYMCCLHKGTWWEQKSYAHGKWTRQFARSRQWRHAPRVCVRLTATLWRDGGTTWVITRQ